MIEKSTLTGVNEEFELIFDAAGAENMNRAKLSLKNKKTSGFTLYQTHILHAHVAY